MNGSVPGDVTSARRLLVLFLGVTFASSYAVEVAIAATGGIGQASPVAMLALMWIPGVVAIVLRRRFPARTLPLGFARPVRSSMLVAYALPFVVAAVGYGVAWALGLAALDVPWSTLAERLPPGPVGLAVLVVAAGTVGVLVGCVFALGEEIGWRGFMVPLMLEARIPAALPVSGLIWGLWHLPLILFAGYATGSSPGVSALIFCAATTIDGVNYGWLRLRAHSIWPAVLIHASHNAYFQQVFDVVFKDRTTLGIAVGESGVLPLLGYAAFALWLWRSGRLQRSGALVGGVTPSW